MVLDNAVTACVTYACSRCNAFRQEATPHVPGHETIFEVDAPRIGRMAWKRLLMIWLRRWAAATEHYRLHISWASIRCHFSPCLNTPGDDFPGRAHYADASIWHRYSISSTRRAAVPVRVGPRRRKATLLGARPRYAKYRSASFVYAPFFGCFVAAFSSMILLLDDELPEKSPPSPPVRQLSLAQSNVCRVFEESFGTKAVAALI